MKPNLHIRTIVTLSLLVWLTGHLVASPTGTPTDLGQPAAKSEPIPMDQIGAVAGKQYSGDGLSVTPTPDGARLRCVFQKLEGAATSEGLWLTSTVTDQAKDRFCVKAVAVSRGSAWSAPDSSALLASGGAKAEGVARRGSRESGAEAHAVQTLARRPYHLARWRR
jgi:hypothetical protein